MYQLIQGVIHQLKGQGGGRGSGGYVDGAEGVGVELFQVPSGSDCSYCKIFNEFSFVPQTFSRFGISVLPGKSYVTDVSTKNNRD